jgi:hypothetical protein
VGTTDTTNPSASAVPPVIDPAAASATDSTSADLLESDAESDNDEAIPPLQNNTQIPFNNSQDIFDLVD